MRTRMTSKTFAGTDCLLVRWSLLAGLWLVLSATPTLGQARPEARPVPEAGSATAASQGMAGPARDGAKADLRLTVNLIEQRDPAVAQALAAQEKELDAALRAGNPRRAEEERATRTQKDNETLRVALQSLRAQAALHIVAAARAPEADAAALKARDGLLSGDMEGAGRVLETEERRLAAAKQELNKAAALARERAALVFDRNVEVAVVALSNATDYEPGNPDNWWLLGDAQVIRGNMTGALNAYMQMQKVLLADFTGDPASTGWRRNLWIAYNRTGDVQVAQGDLQAALKSYRDGLAISASLSQRDPANTGWQRDLAVSHETIGDAQVKQGDLTAAIKSYRNNLAIRAALAKKDPANTDAQRDFSISHEKIGNVQAKQGDLKAALRSYGDSLAISVSLVLRDPANTGRQQDLSIIYEKIGSVQVKQGGLTAALKSYRDGLAINASLAMRDPANTEWQQNLSINHDEIGDVQMAQAGSSGGTEELPGQPRHKRFPCQKGPGQRSLAARSHRML